LLDRIGNRLEESSVKKKKKKRKIELDSFDSSHIEKDKELELSSHNDIIKKVNNIAQINNQLKLQIEDYQNNIQTLKEERKILIHQLEESKNVLNAFIL
jgi:hypothetical protein